MKLLHLSWFLVFVGALNWGLVGLFDFNLLEMIFRGWTNAVYVLVGLAAVVDLVLHPKYCRLCGKGSV